MKMFDSDQTLRGQVMTTTNGMTDAQLAAFARAYMFRGRRTSCTASRPSSDPDVRAAPAVLRELRGNPYTGPIPPEASQPCRRRAPSTRPPWLVPAALAAVTVLAYASVLTRGSCRTTTTTSPRTTRCARSAACGASGRSRARSHSTTPSLSRASGRSSSWGLNASSYHHQRALHAAGRRARLSCSRCWPYRRAVTAALFALHP
jgi:hypothetical protein